MAEINTKVAGIRTVTAPCVIRTLCGQGMKEKYVKKKKMSRFDRTPNQAICFRSIGKKVKKTLQAEEGVG